jgi:NDP-sugar pyrophosphorylase family protein
MNIVVPIAGRGSRFIEAGFKTPKPLIPLHGVPMIEAVIANISPMRSHRFIFVALSEHLRNTGLLTLLSRCAPGCKIITVSEVTEGAACTVLLAREFIDSSEPLMIANTDQWVDVDMEQYLSRLDEDRADGLIMTMTASEPKWSFVRRDADGTVTEVVEKRVVSDEATVGIYNFREGRDFVRAADQMIAKNLRVGGEFYVAPVYNEMIAAGSAITTYNVGSLGNGMWGLGTPADLADFLNAPISLEIRL